MASSPSNVTSGSRLPPALQAQTVFCDTLQSLNSAVQVLRTCRTIFMDCEGVNLGTEGGSLSILSVGAVPPRTRGTLMIYLVDATCFTLTQLGLVFDLLASPDATKVVWDGRSDYSALYHDCNVEMQNVIDLQIVDILSRASRDSPAEHLNRFRGYVQSSLLDKPNVQRRYARLHRLSSLLQAVKEHKPQGHEDFNKVNVEHELWETLRPLPPDYIKYAAMDIEMISCLWDQFRRSGYISKSPFSLAPLKAKCMKYISFWADHQPTVQRRANRYVGNAFLPLELIDDAATALPNGGRYHPNEDDAASDKQPCTKCRRRLTSASFSYSQWRRGKNLSCFVCVAVTENMDHWRMRDRAIARRALKAQKKTTTTAAVAGGPSNSAPTGWRPRRRP